MRSPLRPRTQMEVTACRIGSCLTLPKQIYLATFQDSIEKSHHSTTIGVSLSAENQANRQVVRMIIPAWTIKKFSWKSFARPGLWKPVALLLNVNETSSRRWSWCQASYIEQLFKIKICNYYLKGWGTLFMLPIGHSHFCQQNSFVPTYVWNTRDISACNCLLKKQVFR